MGARKDNNRPWFGGKVGVRALRVGIVVRYIYICPYIGRILMICR